ncbi:ArsR/SmtB family transcription factor [Actinokineospora terrae]|uniref:ArsR/SmtB family transcription factor n=1 Tax=Actinokineospora terrae TaxID=155974 RepID=UPI003CCBFA6C
MAAALALAPSTVSEHLTALVSAGIAHRRRSGKTVLYTLEPAGEVLFALFETTAPPPELG